MGRPGRRLGCRGVLEGTGGSVQEGCEVLDVAVSIVDFPDGFQGGRQ